MSPYSSVLKGRLSIAIVQIPTGTDIAQKRWDCAISRFALNKWKWNIGPDVKRRGGKKGAPDWERPLAKEFHAPHLKPYMLCAVAAKYVFFWWNQDWAGTEDQRIFVVMMES
jgi:hypothetical protein